MDRKNRNPMIFTIDKKIVKEFKEFTLKKFINRSALVEDLIKKWLENEYFKQDKLDKA